MGNKRGLLEFHSGIRNALWEERRSRGAAPHGALRAQPGRGAPGAAGRCGLWAGGRPHNGAASRPHTPPPPPPSDGQRRNGFWVPPLPAPRGRPPGSGPRGALGRGRGSGAGSRRGAARSPFAHFLDGRHHPLDIILRPAPGLGPNRPARHAAGASGREGRGRAAASAAGMRSSARLAASVPPSCPHAQCSHGSARFGAARLRSAPLGSARPPGPARCARAARSAAGSPRAREAGGAPRGDPPMAAGGGFVSGGLPAKPNICAGWDARGSATRRGCRVSQLPQVIPAVSVRTRAAIQP